MSLKFNPSKEKIEANQLNIDGKEFVTISSGLGSNNKEIVRIIKKETGSRVGINKTGEKVFKVTITNPGSGYLDAPSVTASAPTGNNPNAKTAVLSAVRDPDTGSILSVVIVDPGLGYVTPPTITFSEAPITGITARATCELDSIDYDLDILGAIRTSSSIISDSATVNNLSVRNFVTPKIRLNAPELVSYTNLTNPNLPYYGETLYPTSITPPLGDQSDRIATTQFVYNVATNDVGGRVYVSSEIGNDQNNGRSPAKPVKTIKRAAQIAASTPGRETLIVAGGEYYEDNPISIPPLCSVIGDNLRLVIVRPLNPGKHMFKASNQNYMNGITFRDALDSEGNPAYTFNFAFVFDDKQRFYFDEEIGGEAFKRNFPIGHKMFGQRTALLEIKEHNGDITTLQAAIAAATAGSATDGIILGDTTSCTSTITSIVFATPIPDYAWSANATYDVGDVVSVNNSIYRVSVGGDSGTVPFAGQDSTPRTATQGTCAYIYVGDKTKASLNITVKENSPAFSYIADENISYQIGNTIYTAKAGKFTSTRAEGEVVKYVDGEVRNYVVESIDSTQWTTYPTPGDLGTPTAGSGGVIFKFSGLHDLKEFDIVNITKPANAPAELASFFGYQRVDQVLYDADGFSRRIVIKKQLRPNHNTVYLPPAGKCTARSKTSYVELTLLNSPYGFSDSVFTSYRWLDAVTFIRNNRDFIAEEITGAISSKYPDFIYPGTDPTRYRFKDSRNLIYKNLDYIADEVIGWLWTESSYAATWGQQNLSLQTKCRRDVKYFLRGIANDLYDGGNGNSIAVAKSYFNSVSGAPISGGLVGDEAQSVAAFNKARDFAKLAITNSLPLKGKYSTFKPFRDLSLTFDPTTKLNVKETNCANVRSAIDTLASIVTTVITAGNLNSLPTVTTNTTDGENKCKRDIKHVINAVIADLPYGGNALSIEAAKTYINNANNSLYLIDNQHRQSSYAFQLARDYCVLAMRNWKTKINCTFKAGSDVVEVASTLGLVPKMRVYTYNESNEVESDYYIKEVVSPTQFIIWKYATGQSGSDHSFGTGQRPTNLKLTEGQTSFTPLWFDNLVPRTTDYPEFPECTNVASALNSLFTLIQKIVTNNVAYRYFDAANLIESNKDFIAQEVTGWLKDTYKGFAYPLPTFNKNVVTNSAVDAYPAYLQVSSFTNLKVGQLISGANIQDNTYITSFATETSRIYISKAVKGVVENIVVRPDVYLDDSMRFKDASNLIKKNRTYIIEKALAEVGVQYPDFYFPGDDQTNANSRFFDGYRLIQQNKEEIVDTAAAEIAVQYPDFYFPGDVQTNPRSRFFDAYRLIKQNKQEIIDRAAAEIAIQYPDFYYPGDSQTTATSRFKDAYRLIQQNKTSIINTAYAASGGSIPGDTNGTKCKRDLGYFIDAVSLDIAQGGGNVYSRKFIQQYFTNATTPLSNGLVGEEAQSIAAFNKARDEMKKAIANQLAIKDLTVTADPDTGSNTNPASCANVQTAITNLTTLITDRITAGNLTGLPSETTGSIPAGESKCKRDLGFLIDAVALDVFLGGNTYSRKFVQSYFTNATTPLSNGLVGEEAQSVVAFNMARDMMKKAITNQLYTKDLTLTAGPATYGGSGGNIPVSQSGNAASCADVQTTIDTLTTVITGPITAGNLNSLAAKVSGYNDRFQDAANLVYNNKQEIIDRAVAEISAQYSETAWGNNFVIPGDSASNAVNRFKDSYRLIQQNRQEIIDRAAAEIGVQYPDFYYPGDTQSNSTSRFKDSYRLIQLNRQEIIDTAFAQIAVQYPTFVNPSPTKCKRDLGYFIDALSLDIAQGGGNRYTRKFILQYFNNGNPISNGLVGEEAQSNVAFNKARDLMKSAITNQLTIKDLTITADPSPSSGSPSNTNPNSCANVRTAIDTLASVVTSVITAGNVNGLPAETTGTIPAGESKCKRDIGYFIDAISLDICQGSGNVYTRKFVQQYFNNGSPISNGLLGEEAQSIVAFNKARDIMKLAITNQLYTKDFTITADPTTNSNNDETSCANVRTAVDTLTTIVTSVINAGTLTGLPAEVSATITPGETKCKRDVGYFVDAIEKDLKQGGNYNVRKFLTYYFTPDGTTWISAGLNGEQLPSNIAFNKARDVIKGAITNQLYFKDKTITADPLTGSNVSDISCANVRTFVDTLTATVTSTITAGNLGGSTAAQFLAASSQGSPSPNQLKCKRDIGFFTDAVSLDLFTKGNKYSRDFVTQYFTNVSSPLTNGLLGEEGPSVTAFAMANTMMKKAVTNQLYTKDLTLTSGPANYGGGGGNIPVSQSGNAASCTDVQAALDTLSTFINSTLTAGNLLSLDQSTVNTGVFNPGESICARDLGYIVDAVADDVYDGSNWRTINAARYYFQEGNPITNGLSGEENQSVTAFNKARDLMIDAMRNQLLYRDFTITPDAVTNDNYDVRSCANVASNITTLVSIVTTTVTAGNLTALNSITVSRGTYSLNEQKCIRDIKYMIDAVINDITLGSNKNSITYANNYKTGGNGPITFIDGQLIQSLSAFRKTRDLCILAMRNWKEFPQKQYYVKQYADLDYVQDPFVIEDTNIPYCTNVASDITNRFDLIVDILSGNASNRFLDAANQIAINEKFIIEEALAAGENQYPSTSIPSITKCKRDLRFILRAVQKDTILGGNTGITTAADAYISGATGNVTYVNNELAKTLHIYEYAKHLSVAAARNWNFEIRNCTTVNNNNVVTLPNTDGVVLGMRVSANQFRYTNGNTYAYVIGINRTNNTVTLGRSQSLTATAFNASVSTSSATLYFTYSNVGAPWFDAANSIAANKTFIADEAVGYIEDRYPYLTTLTPSTGYLELVSQYNNATCKRDIGYVLDALIHDLRYGGNSETIRAATYYRDAAGHLDSIGNQLIQSIETFKKAKDLAVLAMRNWYINGSNTQYTKQFATSNYVTNSNLLDPAGYPQCSFVESSINSLFQIFIDIITNKSGGTKIDAATLIAKNFKYIAEEALGAANNQYPLINIPNEPKCKRDIQLNMTAWIKDLILGGNSGSIQAAKSYLNSSGAVIYVNDQVVKTRYAFEYAKNLVLQAVTNTLPSTGTYTSETAYKDLTILADPSTGSNTDPASCANIQSTITSLWGILDLVLEQSGAPLPSPTYGTNYNVTVYRSQNIPGIFSGAYFKGTQRPFTDDFITVDSSYPECANVVSTITTIFDILSSVLNGNGLPDIVAQNSYSPIINPGTLYNPTVVQGSGTMIDASNRPVIRGRMINANDIIEVSPYIQNCSIISFLGGGGCEVDGSKIKQINVPRPGLREDGKAKLAPQGKSMVANAFTIISQGGTGYLVNNDGYCQLVSVFCIFCQDGILAESGGYASVTNSASNFGTYALRAVGYRKDPYPFDIGTIGEIATTSAGKTVFKINGLGRKPVENFVMKIDGYSNVVSGIEYYVTVVTGATVGGTGQVSARVEFNDALLLRNNTTGQRVNLNTSELIGKTIRLYRPSIINSSGHSFEYIGSGTDYYGLPENGGQKKEENEQVSQRYGRVYASGTDEAGDFKVGLTVKMQNRTGNIYFTGQVSISEIEFLRIRGGDLIITGFDVSPTMGGAAATNQKLPTQKAVKDFVTNNLGPYFGKPYSNNPIPNALVELGNDGKINLDQIPPIRPFKVYTVGSTNQRLALEGLNAGDIAVQVTRLNDIVSDADIDVDNNQIYTPKTGFSSGQIVTITSSAATPPATNAGPIVEGNTYYIILKAPNYIQLASSPENVIDEVPLTITSAGSGNTGISIATGTVSYILNNDVDSQYLSYAPNIGTVFTTGRLVTGSATGAIGQITSSSFGVVYSIVRATGGDIYQYRTPSVVISAPDQGGGVQATATATVVGTAISSITMTNIGSGYSVAPTVNINVGEIAWSANQSYTVGELINVGLELYEVTTAGTSGTAAFSGQSSIPQPADGGTCFYAYVGERASLQAFVESRVYIKIQNAVKFTDVDTIKSNNSPQRTLDITRVVNISSQNEGNWVPLTSQTIDAGSITTGIISSSRLGTGSANSFTFLRGDQTYKPVVQGIKLPEVKFLRLAYLKSEAGLSYITLERTSLVQTGQKVSGNGILANTIVIDVTVVEGNTRVSISSLITDDILPGQIITFTRTETPLQFESSFTKGGFVDSIFIENSGDAVTTTILSGNSGDNFFTVGDYSGILEDQEVFSSKVPSGALVTSVVPLNPGVDFTATVNIDQTLTQNITNESVTFGVYYNNGTYNNVEIFRTDGGTGTGAKASFTVLGGKITNAVITDGGIQYATDFVVDPIPGILGIGTGAKLRGLVSTQQIYFSNIEVDIKRTTNQTTSLDAFGTVGVSRFLKSQYTFGPNGALTLKTGPESGLDADLLDGKQGAFYLDASNLEAGTLRTDRLSGSYSIDVTGKSGSTARLDSIVDSINAVPAPSAYTQGMTLAVRVSSNFRYNIADRTLENEGDRVSILTLRPSGVGNDAGGGGVKQLAFTDGTPYVNSGGGGSSASPADDVVPNMYLRGSGNLIPTDPTNAWSQWYKVWTSGNDGAGSGLDADKMHGRTRAWYTNALNLDGGSISDARLQPIMSSKKFLNSINLTKYIDFTHYEIYFSNRLNNGDLNYSIGQQLNLYNDNLQNVGQVTIKQIEQKFPLETINTELNYVIYTVSLDTGIIGAATRIGTTGNEQPFTTVRISSFGTYTSATLQDDGTGARLILGRNDSNIVSNNVPANGAIIDFHSSGRNNDYDVRFQVTGGSSDNGTGSLNITGAGFTYNTNTVWHSGNDTDTSGLNANFLQGITKSQVMRSDTDTSTSGNISVGGTTTLTGFLTVNDAAQLADNTVVDPDNYSNKVVAGLIADGGSLSLQGIAGSTGTGRTWAIGNSGSSLYLAIGNGSAANTLATWAQVDADRTIRFFAKDNSSIFYSSGSNDYRIWNENNDGAGSGLDADLLDGRDFNTRDYSILRTSGDHIAGGIYITGGATKYQTSNYGFLLKHSDATGVGTGAGGRLDFVFADDATRSTDTTITTSRTFSFDKSGQLIIPAPQGTAPLTVSSTTKVTNLNADLLDDQTGAYYTNMNNADAGTLSALRGGTGINSYAVGDLLYANATTPTLTKLNIGTAGQVLTVNSGATAPQWVAQSTLTSGQSNTIKITSETATDSSYAIPFFATNVSYTNVLYNTDATTGLFFNPFTGTLTTKIFSGSFTGNASSATAVSVGGAAGSLLYQSGANVTTSLPIGNAGQVLIVNPTANAPLWTNQINITAGNIAGGNQGELLFQSASGTTSKLAVGTSGYILRTNGTGANPTWVAQNTITAGNIDAGSAGQLLYQSGAGATAKLTVGTDGQVLFYDGTNTKPIWRDQSNVTAGNINGGAQGDILYQSAASTTSKLAAGTAGYVLQTGGAGANPSWLAQSSITAGNIAGGTAGQILYQSAAGATSKLAIGTAGQALIVNVGATAPSWTDQANLTAGNISSLAADNFKILYQSAANTTSKLSTGTANQVLISGGSAAAPSWTDQTNITAGNISSGAAGQLLYQSGAGTTSKLAVGTNGYVLTYNTTSVAPQWTDPTTLTAGNITSVAGDNFKLLYQSAANTTSKLSTGTANQVLLSGGSAAAPSWTNQSSLAVGTATNIAAGAAGSIPYQTAAGATTTLAIGGSNAILTSSGSAPQWTTNTSVTVGTSNNISGGVAGNILYQSGAGATAKLATGTANQVLTVNTGATAPQWVNQSTLAAGTAVSTVPASGNTVGAILYQSAVGTTSGLAAVATGQVLVSAGVNTAPVYQTRSTITDIGAANNLSLTDPTGTFTGQIATTCLAITTAPTGTLTLGNILSGTGVTAGTRISQFGFVVTAGTSGATITAITSTTSSFTVTHSAFPIAIPVGSFVQISGVTPNGYCNGNQTVNGIYGLWLVNSSTTTTTTITNGAVNLGPAFINTNNGPTITPISNGGIGLYTVDTSQSAASTTITHTRSLAFHYQSGSNTSTAINYAGQVTSESNKFGQLNQILRNVGNTPSWTDSHGYIDIPATTTLNLLTVAPYAKWFYIELWSSGAGGGGGHGFRNNTGATGSGGGASGASGGYRSYLIPASSLSSSNSTGTIAAGGLAGVGGLINSVGNTSGTAGGAGSITTLSIPLKTGSTITLSSAPAPNAGGGGGTTTAGVANNSWSTVTSATTSLWGYQDSTDIALAGMNGQNASITATPTQNAWPTESSLSPTSRSLTQTGKAPTGGGAGASLSTAPAILSSGVPANVGSLSYTSSTGTSSTTTAAGTLTTTAVTTGGQAQLIKLTMNTGAALSVGQFINFGATATNAYVVATGWPWPIQIRNITATSTTAITVDTGNVNWQWPGGGTVTISGTTASTGSATQFNQTVTITSSTATGFTASGTGFTNGATMVTSGLAQCNGTGATGGYTISIPLTINAVAASTAATPLLTNLDTAATPGYDLLTTGWAGLGGNGGVSNLHTGNVSVYGQAGGEGGWPGAGGGGGGAARIFTATTTNNGAVTGSIANNTLTVTAITASQTATSGNNATVTGVNASLPGFGILNIGSVSAGAFTTGMTVTGSSLPAGTTIVALGTGTTTGGAGTYIIYGQGLANIGANFTCSGSGQTQAQGMGGSRLALGASLTGTGVAAGTAIKTLPTYSTVSISSITPYWGGAVNPLLMGFVVACSATHGLAVGDLVQIAGTTANTLGTSGVTGWANAYNGYWIVSSVPSTTSFMVYQTWNTGSFIANFTASTANFTVTTATNTIVTGASISCATAGQGPGQSVNSSFFIQARNGGTGAGGGYTLNTGTGISAFTGATIQYALIPGAAGAAGTVLRINNGGVSGSPTTNYIVSGKAQTVASTSIVSAVTAKGGDGGAGGRGHIRVYWY